MSIVNVNWNPLKENTIIVGAAQEGKTNCGIQIANTLFPSYNIIIFTPHEDSQFKKLNPACVKRNIYDIKGHGLEIIIPWIVDDKFFNDLCGRVFELTNVVFFIDEIHNFVTKYRIPKNLQILVENCNNRNIGYVAIFQRPQRVENSILSNSNHRFCFMLDLPNDIKYMKEYVGVEAEMFKRGEIPKYYGLYKKKGDRIAQTFYLPEA